MSRLLFFFYGAGDHRDLHVLPPSSPTLRSSDLLGGATCNCQRIDEFQTPATAVPAASCAGVKRPFMTTSAQVVLSSSAVPLDSVIEHDVTRPLASMSTANRSEEHTSELQSLMRISYAVFCLKKKKQHNSIPYDTDRH